MAQMTASEMREFLDAPRIAHLTTLRADGSPHTSPVWFEYADGAFTVFTSEQFLKAKLLRKDRRVSLSIASDDEPYRYVAADGLAKVGNADAIERASSVATRYRGGDEGPAYAKWVDETFGGLLIVELTPVHLVAWRSGGEGQ